MKCITVMKELGVIKKLNSILLRGFLLSVGTGDHLLNLPCAEQLSVRAGDAGILKKVLPAFILHSVSYLQSHAYLASGFQPGKVYQVIYTTTGAPVSGLGLLAIRDFGSFLRYGSSAEGNPCAGNIEHAYVSGVSQSGRFLRLFLYAGINADEEGRTAFDGFIPHVAGGKRGEFNQRFAQPSSQAARSTNSIFPFSDTAQTDPETGLTDGVLSRLSAQGRCRAEEGARVTARAASRRSRGAGRRGRRRRRRPTRQV